MSKRISSPLDILSPSPFVPQTFDDPVKAVDVLTELYERNTNFLIESFASLAKGAPITSRYRAFYPQVSIETTSYGHVDTRLSYGHVTAPGIYTTTITRPQLFRHYLKQQLGLLMKNHDVPVVVSESTTPIPLHFAFGEGAHVEASAAAFMDIPMRDLFDTPDLNTTDDEIANGEYIPPPGEPSPLAAFTAQRIDYSLARLAHYTETGKRVVDALSRKGGKRRRFTWRRNVYAVGNLVVRCVQVRRVKQITHRNVHERRGGCLDMGTLTERKVQWNRRRRF